MRSGVLATALLLCGCQATPQQRFSFERAAMGTTFRLVLYAGDAWRAEEAAQAAFARIADLDRILSDYDPGSELSRLGRLTDGGARTEAVAVSPDLEHVLRAGEEVARASSGAFDLTVGPYVQLWRRARRQGELPDPGALAEAARSVGFGALEVLPPGRVRLHAPGMRLDAGGIAKGYALDAALVVLREHGIRRALLDGGGDLLAAEPPPGRPAWRVRLAGFSEPGECVELVRAALATSGDLERFFEANGRRWSHVIDPRTGQALSERRLVSVWAPTGIEADAWATALSVSGPGGLSRFQTLADRGARLVVRSEGQAEDVVFRSPGFPASLSCGPPAESLALP